MVSVEPPPEELLFPTPVSRAEFQRVQSSLGQLDRETVHCQVSHALVFLWTSRSSTRIHAFNGYVCNLLTKSGYDIFKHASREQLPCLYLSPPSPPPPFHLSVSRQIPPADVSRLPSRILRAVNAAVVANDSAGQDAEKCWWFSASSLAGSMSERVFIKASVDDGSGKVVVEVYSDNSLLPSKLTKPLKKAVEENSR